MAPKAKSSTVMKIYTSIFAREAKNWRSNVSLTYAGEGFRYSKNAGDLKEKDKYLLVLKSNTTINEIKLVAHHNAALSSQFQKAMRHLAACKRRKCSVCSYTKAAFGIPQNPKYERKLFSCLQTPFQEMRNMIKPPPSPISGEGESMSEWFRPLFNPSASPSECSSLSIPFAELAITFMDDASDSFSNCQEIDDKYKDDGISHTSQACASIRGFGSDSGFASDCCPDYKSNTTSKEKFHPKSTLDEADCAKLTRTKWTASFRKLINRIKK
ncbi:uncharacterized protein LOC116174646 [Photinus pyralis]|uniref:uncharacterized protein LOC116174646 n=1 Tax=Photinus pyralis TaxID=7054 RepID=UPI0012675040|nr:uncharacterized protein LOC116174646 [Photinus pyralis]